MLVWQCYKLLMYLTNTGIVFMLIFYRCYNWILAQDLQTVMRYIFSLYLGGVYYNELK